MRRFSMLTAALASSWPMTACAASPVKGTIHGEVKSIQARGSTQ